MPAPPMSAGKTGRALTLTPWRAWGESQSGGFVILEGKLHDEIGLDIIL